MASTPGYALAQLWASLDPNTSIASRLATVNATSVAGPNVDVTIQQVAGYLLLSGIYPTITAFAAGSKTGDPTHDAALTALQTFTAWIALANAPPVHLSMPNVYAAVNQLGSVVVAQETASPGSTGFTQAVLNGALALGETTLPWWQANGFGGPITTTDVNNAGLK